MKKTIVLIIALIAALAAWSDHERINIKSDFIILNGDTIQFQYQADGHMIYRVNGKWVNLPDTFLRDSIFYNDRWYGQGDTLQIMVPHPDSTFIDLYDTPEQYPANIYGYGLIADTNKVRFSAVHGADTYGFWAKTQGVDTINAFVDEYPIADYTGTWIFGTTSNQLTSATGTIKRKAFVQAGNTYEIITTGLGVTSQKDGSASDTVRAYVDGIKVGEYYHNSTFAKIWTYTATHTDSIDLLFEVYNTPTLDINPTVGRIMLYGSQIIDSGSIRVVDQNHQTIYILPGYLGRPNQPIISNGTEQLVWGNALDVDTIYSRIMLSDTTHVSVLVVDSIYSGDGSPINQSSDSLYYDGIWRKNGDSIIFVESDPVFSAWDKDYSDLINKPTIINSQWVDDANGINYDSGNVGIGIVSNASHALDIAYSTGVGEAVHILSHAGAGIFSQSTYQDGVIGLTSSATRYGGVFSGGRGLWASKIYVGNNATSPSYTFATVDGSNGQVQATNGAGVLSWVDLPTLSESDPIFSAWDKDYNDLINRPTIINTQVRNASVSLSAGDNTVTFTSAMPNTNYALNVSALKDGIEDVHVWIISKSTTGFTCNVVTNCTLNYNAIY